MVDPLRYLGIAFTLSSPLLYSPLLSSHPNSTGTSDTTPLPSSLYVLRYICGAKEQQPARADTQSAGNFGIGNENGRRCAPLRSNYGTVQNRFFLRRK